MTSDTPTAATMIVGTISTELLHVTRIDHKMTSLSERRVPVALASLHLTNITQRRAISSLSRTVRLHAESRRSPHSPAHVAPGTRVGAALAL